MYLVNVSVINVIICIASTAAIEFCPAFLAGWLGINMSSGKFLLDLLIEGALLDVTHAILLMTNKLMARVNISIRRNGNILVSAATATKTLDHTWLSRGKLPAFQAQEGRKRHNGTL